MFGGSAVPWGGSLEQQSKLADTTILQFCKYMNIVFIGDSISGGSCFEQGGHLHSRCITCT